MTTDGARSRTRPRSRCAASRSAIRAWSPTTTSTSTSGPARSTPCSARTAPARRTLMNILYGLARPTRARSCSTASRSRSPARPTRSPAASAWSTSTSCSCPVLHRRREHPPRRGDDGQPDLPRPHARPAGGSVELGRAVRLRDRSRRQGRHAVGRLAAAGRDPQGALPRRADPRPRRADGRPDAPGDRGDLRRPAPARRARATASSSSATSSTRSSRSPTGSRSSGAARSSASGSRPRPTRTTWPS